jgi:ABC-type nitrate/sulfonate/bicarbonate transport system permease component
MLKNSSNAFDTASTFAVILVVSLFGLACQEGVRFAERRIIPWHHGSET